MKRIEIENTGNKLSRQLLSMVDSSKGNNYEDTHISVGVSGNHVVVSTFCVNEYGSAWCNQNHTKVNRSNVPFFTAKKLGMV